MERKSLPGRQVPKSNSVLCSSSAVFLRNHTGVRQGLLPARESFGKLGDQLVRDFFERRSPIHQLESSAAQEPVFGKAEGHNLPLICEAAWGTKPLRQTEIAQNGGANLAILLRA